ncbi:MAG TPA: ATP-binding protein [Candidatus Acidoferrales bacterium]|nr:ATP-binding protein [Candidatus Acidoferrales bacterium]
MLEPHPRAKFGWIDALGLLFLLALALLPPVAEIHKQLTIVAIGLAQVFEGRLVAWRPGRGRVYAVVIKILLATLLLGHTSDSGSSVDSLLVQSINSEYWPIYFLPVVTAAIYFETVATLLWTALASLCYCTYLIAPIVVLDYEITWRTGYALLTIRLLFLFLAAVLVNQFVTENRRQVQLYQSLSESLAESNRKLQQAQEEARRAERLAALGQLSAGLAHEIRNPLGVIKGSAEMLAQKLGSAPPLAGELAGYISSEVNRLNSLVARFLDFARPSHLDLRAVAVAPLVDRALDAARNQLPAANIKIQREFAANLPEVLADEQFCEQVFLNLVLNAFEAMGAERGSSAQSSQANPGGTLRVSIVPDSREGSPGVAIEFEDTGPGVPAELREQIFNPFVTSKKSGVGLGLSIVAKIVDDHGGAIQLISKDHSGASFRVFLPAAAAAAKG